MQKVIALMLILSLSINNALYALDDTLTVGQGISLVNGAFEDEVSLLDGCCDANQCCNSNVGCMYVVAGVFGFACLIIAAALTGVAFPSPDRYEHRPDFNPVFFAIGMTFWGLFGASVVGPPAIILTTNWFRNRLIRSANNSHTEMANVLDVILDDRLPLENHHIEAMAELIFQADPAIHKSLSPGQALTLALIDLNQLRRLSDENLLNAETNDYAIKLLMFYDMSEKDRKIAFQEAEFVDLCQKEPAFCFALKALLPYSNINNNDREKLLSHSHVLLQISDDESNSFSNDYPENSVALSELSLGQVTIMVNQHIYKISKDSLRCVSMYFDNMFTDSYTDKDSVIELQGDQSEGFKALYELTKLSDEQIKSIIINKNNFAYFLTIDRNFDCPLINDMCDAYYIKTPSSDCPLVRLNFVVDNDLKRSKALVVQALGKRLKNIDFGELEYQMLSKLLHNDINVLVAKIQWLQLFQNFRAQPVLLAQHWQWAKSNKIQAMIDGLRTFANDDENKPAISRAWKYRPKDF